MTAEAEDLLEDMHRRRGYVHPVHPFLAEVDPGFLRVYDGFVRTALLHEDDPERPAELGVALRELVVSAVLAYRASSPVAIGRHLKRAFEHGATEKQALEAFEAAMVPGGAPTFLRGAEALLLLRQEASEQNG